MTNYSNQATLVHRLRRACAAEDAKRLIFIVGTGP